MPAGPNRSILLARAVGLRRRADALACLPAHPFTKDQIALVALAARDAQAWLGGPDAIDDADRLPFVSESLDVQGKRLDELEDLVRTHGAHEGPRGEPTSI